MIISPCFGYRSQTVGGGTTQLGGNASGGYDPTDFLPCRSTNTWICVVLRKALCSVCNSKFISRFLYVCFFRLNYTFNNFDWWYKGTFLNAGLPSFLMSFRDLFWVFCFMGDCCYPVLDTFHLRNNLNLLYGCIQSMLHQLKAPILMLTLQAHVMFGLRTKDRIWRKRQTMRSWKTI